MAQDKRIDSGPRRHESGVATGPAIAGDGVASGLGAELGVPPRAAGAGDPAMGGAKPAMLGVYEQPMASGRFGALGPLILVLIVIGILLLLVYVLFAAHGGGGHAADAMGSLGSVFRLIA